MNFVVDFEWRSIGSLKLDAGGRIAFPALPADPGVYQFDLRSGPRSVLYIGESDNLKRRAQNYRTPGPSQPTNLRLNARLVEHLREGGAVELSITTRARVEIAGEWGDLDMTWKPSRLLVENGALLLARKQAIPVENL
jgi:hypothetical protein